MVVNVQGDEPLINPEHIDTVARTLIDSDADVFQPSSDSL